MKRSDVKCFAVMGLGKMGVDWVANLLEGGYEVVGFDTVAAARERAPGALAKGLGWIGKKRRPDEPDFADEAAARFPQVRGPGPGRTTAPGRRSGVDQHLVAERAHDGGGVGPAG